MQQLIVIESICLKKVKGGWRYSLELGTLGILLEHIVDNKSHDKYAKELDNYILPLLTGEGKEALHNRKMIEIIESRYLEKYRNPGAHTGYVPFSVACESREYVLEKLPIILSWFTN